MWPADNLQCQIKSLMFFADIQLMYSVPLRT